MKQATLKITLQLDIAYKDSYDDAWVCERYLDSSRCSVDRFSGEVGTIMCASAGVDIVRYPQL